jgi:hypothetical protein
MAVRARINNGLKTKSGFSANGIRQIKQLSPAKARGVSTPAAREAP